MEQVQVQRMDDLLAKVEPSPVLRASRLMRVWQCLTVLPTLPDMDTVGPVKDDA